jgi:hypothetical protein
VDNCGNTISPDKRVPSKALLSIVVAFCISYCVKVNDVQCLKQLFPKLVTLLRGPVVGSTPSTQLSIESVYCLIDVRLEHSSNVEEPSVVHSYGSFAYVILVP